MSTTLWCPRCRGEYREGFLECADCGVALVPLLPPEPVAHAAPRRPIPALRPEDESVEVLRLNPVEAELVAAQLREAGIRTEVLGVWAGGEMAGVQFSEGSRVRVPRADLAAARALLRDLARTASDSASLDASDLAAQADAAAGWSDPESGAVV